MKRKVDWYARGTALEAEGRIDEAEKAYLEATRARPGSYGAWFDLGLLYKRARRWDESLRCNLRATLLARGHDDDGAFWNLGIAATALGDWARAREAWRRFGLDAPGSGPIELPLGPVPIRLDPDGNAEIVWCRRIDPARAIIESIPLPESGRRYHDLLLHDGAPRGYREVDGMPVPVFDEIELLQASTCSTFRVTVEAPDEAAVDALRESLGAEEMSVEDWTATVRRLCKACSEGTPHDHHRPSSSGWAPSRELGLAAVDEGRADALLGEWAAAAPGRSRGKLTRALAGGMRS
jgi:tetratricopeptide (TPR) repeat protein